MGPAFANQLEDWRWSIWVHSKCYRWWFPLAYLWRPLSWQQS